MTVAIGIDIGVTGAVATVDSRRTCAVVDLPTVAIEGKRVVRRKIAVVGLRDILLSLAPPGVACMAVFEDVHMGMGKGGAARSSLDLNRGRIEALLELLRVPVHVVQPAVWKRHHGLLKAEKAHSLELARRLFPSAAHLLQRQKDHNRAESLLIAAWAQETLT